MSVLFIVVSKVTDQDKLDQYMAAVGPSIAGRQLEILSADTHSKVIEGTAPGTRTVVLKFPDEQAFRDWYDSPEYQAVVHLRLAGTEGFGVLCAGM